VIEKEDHHVIAILDGDPPVLLVSLFGEYGAFLPLGELAEGQLTPSRTAFTFYHD